MWEMLHIIHNFNCQKDFQCSRKEKNWWVVQSQSSHEARSIDSVFFQVVFFALWLIQSSLEHTGFLEFCVMFGCGSLHLSPSMKKNSDDGLGKGL